MVGKHAKNAVSERLNNQIKEREEERKREIQRKREEELAALKSRSQSQSVLETDKVPAQQNRLNDISQLVSGKAKSTTNVVANMKSAMKLEDNSKSGPVVFDLNDFYRKQRSQSEKSKQNKNEAAQNLHGFKGVKPSNDNNNIHNNSIEEDSTEMTTTKTTSITEEIKPQSTFDFKDTDYRSFIFVIHEDFGLMMLYCTHKRQKGPHFQLPGGHVDEAEFISASRKNFSNPKEHLLFAAKKAAARELFEETGLDFRNELARLEPAHLAAKPHKPSLLTNEFHHRIFFVIHVDDHDFVMLKNGETPGAGLSGPLSGQGSYLLLKLSHEHSGFTFEKDMTNASKLLRLHSGGKCQQALNKYLEFQASGETPEPIEIPCNWIETPEKDIESSTSNQPPSAQSLGSSSSKWEVIPAKSQETKSAFIAPPVIKPIPTKSYPNGAGLQMLSPPATTHTPALIPNLAIQKNRKYQEQYMKTLTPTKEAGVMDRTGIEVLSDDEDNPQESSSLFCFCCRRNKRQASGESQSLLKH